MVSCETCDRYFSTNKALLQHCHATGHPSLYTCCGRTFGGQEALEQHRSNAPVHAVKFECRSCNKSFRSEQALEQHLVNAPIHAVTYDCRRCNKSFKSEEALQQHFSNAPVHIQPECQPCGRVFNSEEALQQHERDSPAHARSSTRMPQHSLDSAASPECQACEDSFVLDRHLHDHVLTEHAGVAGPTNSLHPCLHDDVSDLLGEEGLSFNFHWEDSHDDALKSYDTTIMGRFTCRNEACRADEWESKRIAISIRLYAGEEYNALVWHQRCGGCERPGRLVLGESYAERVAYRLKRWSGVRLDPPPYSGESNAPHQSQWCEGCKAGHCRDSRL